MKGSNRKVRPRRFKSVTGGGDSPDRAVHDACIREGAVVCGVASAADVDTLPRIKVRWGINRYSRKPTSIMPSARSVVVFGILSTDDTHEVAVRIKGDDYEYPGYLLLSHIRKRVVSVLRERGYECVLPSERNAMLSYKRIVPLAGIGAFGKNSLIISPDHGPWLRFAMVLTDAPLKPGRTFRRDLCGDCTKCIDACPVGALKPYVVDDRKCLVGVDPWTGCDGAASSVMKDYQPKLTKRSYVMCTACQFVCPYTSDERRSKSYVLSMAKTCRDP